MDEDDFKLVAEVNDMHQLPIDKYIMLPTRNCYGFCLIQGGTLSLSPPLRPGPTLPHPRTLTRSHRLCDLLYLFSHHFSRTTMICGTQEYFVRGLLFFLIVLLSYCFPFSFLYMIHAMFAGPRQGSRGHHFPDYHGRRHSHTPCPPPRTAYHPSLAIGKNGL